MLVSEVLTLAKQGEVANLSLKNGNDDILIGYINLGLIELHKRFNIAIRAEVVNTYPITNIYTLHNKDLSRVIEVYDNTGKRLSFPIMQDDASYDIKEVSYNTFMLTAPTEGQLAFVYIAAPTLVTSSTEELDLPYIMLEPLLHYVGYRAHGAMNGNVDGENNTHYMRFEKSCKTLIEEGYANNSIDALLPKDMTKEGWV